MLTRRLAGASILGGAAAAVVQPPAFCADIWAKPPSEWTEKDIQRMFSDSPWARKVEVAFGGGGPGGGGGGGGFGGPGGGGGGGGADTGAMGEGGGGGMPGGGGGGGGGRRGGGGRGGAGGGGGAMPTMMFTIRWMSAIPLKQATIRARLGKEADSSAEAKQFLDRQEPHYAIALIGPARPMSAQQGRGAPQTKEGQTPLTPEQRAQRMVERLKEVTSLNRKSKEPIRPEVVQAAQQSQNSFLFLFPKSDAITLDDKDVEFATRIGPLEVKRKFKLKDMVYQGQLSL